MDNSNHVLTRLMTKIQEAGQAWVEAKKVSDQLGDQYKNILAVTMKEIEKEWEKDSRESLSETKLERLARATPAFHEYTDGLCAARAKTLSLLVHYESLKGLWESRRSELSFEREKVARGIYHEGRG